MIRVTLQRQIIVEVRSQRVVRTLVCGEGFLRRIRLDSSDDVRANDGGPSTSSRRHLPTGSSGSEDEEADWTDDDWAGWEGEVIPSNQIQVGGFRAAGLTIRVRPVFNFFRTACNTHGIF